MSCYIYHRLWVNLGVFVIAIKKEVFFLISSGLLALVVMSITSAEQINLVRDANGNLVSGDGFYREYNGFNQLARVRFGNNASAPLVNEFQYDPIENRVILKENYYLNGTLKETIYYWSKTFVTKINESGEFDYVFVYMEGELVAVVNPDGSKYFIHGDHLGSVSSVTDEQGNVIDSLSFGPYGEILSGGTSIRYSYAGKEWNSVMENYDFHARMYDPNIAQFIQPDPGYSQLDRLGKHMQKLDYNPQNLNRYAYANNNPYRYTDDSGLWAVQVGGSGSGGVVPFTGSGGLGIAISSDEEEGFQFGVYTGSSSGVGGIAGLKGTLDISYSPNARRVSDLRGSSYSYGGSAAYRFGVGYDYSKSKANPSYFSHTLHIGVGIALEGHYTESNTYTYTLYPSGGRRSSRDTNTGTIKGGEYCSSLGAYISEDGRVYPTSNPDWRPPGEGDQGGDDST